MALRLPFTPRPSMQIDVKNFRAGRPGYKISWQQWVDYHGINVSSIITHDDLPLGLAERHAANLRFTKSPSACCGRHPAVSSGCNPRLLLPVSK